MSAAEFYQKYVDNGFAFRNSILTRYALALHSKPFVILSGVSGTGKTKIAQLFDPVSKTQNASVQPQAQQQLPKKRLSFNVTKGMKSDGRGNIAKAYMSTIFEQDKLDEINKNIEELNSRGVADNVISPVPIIVETPEGEEIKFEVYVQRAINPLIRLRSKSKSGEQVNKFDSIPYLKKNFEDNEIVEIEKIAPYRFKIVTENKTPEDELKQTSIHHQIQSVGSTSNKLFISVQSNWTDRSELFGFYNSIEQNYSSTRLIKFILEAYDNPDIPHFLILDEMNLSKVEHYFSDFLSCIESRVMSGGNFSQQPIHLHNRGEFLPSDDPLVEDIPADLYIPRNLYVTGTVNIDETTYMFSPKVLDRASVLEFNDVDLSLLENNAPNLDDDFTLNTMPTFGDTAPVTTEDFRASPQLVKDTLKRLIQILEPHSMHFGYRVTQEICRFVNSARNHIEDNEVTIYSALDAAITQKVLPKFGGSQGQLEAPLREILSSLLNTENSSNKLTASSITEDWLTGNSQIISESKFPLSTNKITRMLRELYIRGYTNFIG